MTKEDKRLRLFDLTTIEQLVHDARMLLIAGIQEDAFATVAKIESRARQLKNSLRF